MPESQDYYAKLKRSALLQDVAKGVVGTVILLILYEFFSKALPALQIYINDFFLVLFVALVGSLLASFFERAKQYNDPNMFFFTKQNEERTRGLELSNEAKEVFIEKVKCIPLTMEQATQFYKLANIETKEEKEGVMPTQQTQLA